MGDTLEIYILDEDHTWSTDKVKVPFALDNSSECWEKCEKYCKQDILVDRDRYDRAFAIFPADICSEPTGD